LILPVYTVHEPPRRDDELLAHTARFRFVRDGFHFWAFLLAPIWMLRHRLWLEFIAYSIVTAGLTFALRRLGLAETAGLWVALLVAILVGIEASSLLRWKLARRGYDNLGVVVADDLEEAERRFFGGWVNNAGRLTIPTPSAPVAPSPFDRPPASSDIVGLFPQPEARP
jgi:hypothetical protein